jgi:hypothetical protein
MTYLAIDHLDILLGAARRVSDDTRDQFFKDVGDLLRGKPNIGEADVYAAIAQARAMGERRT